ncbi:sodium:calcium antiporter [Marilutibacter maris]|uniref:Sodium/calcium exchanger membrane region n=1 Tax=Marilutibacter maris TaxID=1605891 RepID=A0A2U9TEG4_9GAMM|nr:sodium:calcium antiporter [Lysobacter maris]AWV07989.1 Sodium/calcium exchanger membrane region [Lysobacter maris]KAB8170754.1 sodium:calcium antiporter [Lysobacter maris]
MSDLPLPFLCLLFALAAAVVWRAGTVLSRTTDRLDEAFGWGEAIGGMVLLAIVTNLPEIAITASASLQGRVEVAIGNLLGGVAIQTVVLVALDFAARREGAPLSALAGSPQLKLEAALVVAMLGLVLLGHVWESPPQVAGLSVPGLLIVAAWFAALLGMRRLSRPQATPADAANATPPRARPGLRRCLLHFAIASLATLVAGVALELSGDAIAEDLGMSGAVFAATILAAATAIPEVASGLESIRLRRWQLAMSDIFGGNAFLPVLLVLAALLSGQAVLPQLGGSDLYLGALGLLLTLCYLAGMARRDARRRLGVGVDSLCVLALYALGIAGLAAMSP